MKLASPETLARFTPRDQYELSPAEREGKSTKPAAPKPKKNAISYYFRVPTPADKAAFKRRLLEEGVREWSVNRQLGLLQREVKRLVDEKAPGWSAEDLQAVTDYRDLMAEDPQKAIRSNHPAGDVMDRIADESEAWQTMEIDRETRGIQAGTVFCKMFLRATEGLQDDFEVGPGGEVTDEMIARLIPDHVEAIDLYQETTFWGPTAREAKNSGLPSRSDSSRGSSSGTAKGKTSRRKARGEKDSGTSSASAGQNSESIPTT